MSVARDRWLDEGVRVLEEQGSTGIRIDKIAARLGLSKGSFHHHFEGAEAYKVALLARIEQMSTAALEEASAHASSVDKSPRAVLGALIDLLDPAEGTIYRPELEVAVRSWSTVDPDARAVQQRIDQSRISALEAIWRPLVPTDAEARVAALLPYLLAVGAAMVTPPVPSHQLREIFRLLVPLIPEHPDAGQDRREPDARSSWNT
ncbi:TetR/AcrR family transcriptional regulator [Microbacterium sp. ZW T2_14]|uniref:TetR/AcrR family transcriptional regulator n=1 Tax=Microbacterium sp. ZW T2_14 TaxID=3378079 RepID=UPI003854A63E